MCSRSINRWPHGGRDIWLREGQDYRSRSYREAVNLETGLAVNRGNGHSNDRLDARNRNSQTLRNLSWLRQERIANGPAANPDLV